MSFRSSSPSPPDIITYRYCDELVYVKPEASYELALNVALKEYPDLAEQPRERIVFTTMATMAGARQKVRISSSAWENARCRLLRGEVVDIEVLPDPDEKRHSLPPPQYLEVPGTGEKAYRSHSAPVSRAPSPAPSSTKKSFFRSFVPGQG